MVKKEFSLTSISFTVKLEVTKSDEEIDDIIESKGEAWTDRLAEVFQDKKNKKKVTKEFQKYIDCEGDYSGAGYAIILNGKRAY